jgi:signal transduction histidine kinase
MAMALSSANSPLDASQQTIMARILVVEDDLNLLEGIQTMLELDSYSVVCAENGRQALEILRSSPTPPDLIVSDIMMPQMDGIEFLKAVRAVDEWESIPFIFLTARGERSDIVRGKQLGVDDYLVKPFDAAELIATIQNKLHRMAIMRRNTNSVIEEIKQRILKILNHEFRTPLTYVVAYSDLLDGASGQELTPEEMTTFLRGVSTGAVRLRRLIENFIHLVEMETGEAQRSYELRKAPISDVRELWEHAIHTLRGIRTITHTINLVIDPVPTFVGDEVYLRLALLHLLDNACKFSPADTTVTLGVHRVDDEVCFWIQDDGRGIDPAEHEQIWKSFYQSGRDRYEDPGTGSGLTIVYNVAKLHGGRATVESRLNAGSRFSIFIPVAR